MRWVGRPLPRYEDPALLQGRGRYTADLAQGARILRFVRSPVARGRILAVNAPGVEPLMAMADMPRALPGARVPRPCPRRRQQHLPDGALSWRVAARHHRSDGAADGLRGRPARARRGRNPAP